MRGNRRIRIWNVNLCNFVKTLLSIYIILLKIKGKYVQTVDVILTGRNVCEKLDMFAQTFPVMESNSSMKIEVRLTRLRVWEEFSNWWIVKMSQKSYFDSSKLFHIYLFKQTFVPSDLETNNWNKNFTNFSLFFLKNYLSCNYNHFRMQLVTFFLPLSNRSYANRNIQYFDAIKLLNHSTEMYNTQCIYETLLAARLHNDTTENICTHLIEVVIVHMAFPFIYAN